jgi:hypothetical protein
MNFDAGNHVYVELQAFSNTVADNNDNTVSLSMVDSRRLQAASNQSGTRAL